MSRPVTPPASKRPGPPQRFAFIRPAYWLPLTVLLVALGSALERHRRRQPLPAAAARRRRRRPAANTRLSTSPTPGPPWPWRSSAWLIGVPWHSPGRLWSPNCRCPPGDHAHRRGAQRHPARGDRPGPGRRVRLRPGAQAHRHGADLLLPHPHQRLHRPPLGVAGGAAGLHRTLHASRLEMLWHVRMPSALPYLFTALRVVFPLSIIGAVVAELSAPGAAEGLGTVISVASSQQPPRRGLRRHLVPRDHGLAAAAHHHRHRGPRACTGTSPVRRQERHPDRSAAAPAAPPCFTRTRFTHHLPASPVPASPTAPGDRYAHPPHPPLAAVAMTATLDLSASPPAAQPQTRPRPRTPLPPAAPSPTSGARSTRPPARSTSSPGTSTRRRRRSSRCIAADELGYFDALCLDVDIQPGTGDTSQNAQLLASGTGAPSPASTSRTC